MIKPTKLQETELQELNSFQEQSSNLIEKLGQLSLKKLQIEIEEQNLKSLHQQLIKLETEISSKLKEKYGDVQIDIKTGEIIYS